MKRIRILLVFAALWAIPVMSADVPWNRFDDARSLNDAQRAVAAQVMSEFPCYAGCAGTILECARKGDRYAVRLANFVARRAALDHSFGSPGNDSS